MHEPKKKTIYEQYFSFSSLCTHHASTEIPHGGESESSSFMIKTQKDAKNALMASTERLKMSEKYLQEDLSNYSARMTFTLFTKTGLKET